MKRGRLVYTEAALLYSILMRIVIVTPLIPPEPGGPSYYSVALQAALEKVGYTVPLLAFRSVRSYPSGLRHVLFFLHVLRAARTADLFIILDTVSVALPAVLAARLLRKPVFIRTGGDFVWERYIERTGEKVLLAEFYVRPRALSYKERILIGIQKRIIFPLTTRIIFSTAWQRDIWEKPYDISRERTAIIDNCVLAPEKTQGTSQVSSGAFLWVGRDLVLKNVSVLRSAMVKLKEQRPEAELVELTNVPHERVVRALREARCLVLPSVSEVSPNLVYEALALGTPVIATAETGIKAQLTGVVRFIDPLSEVELLRALEEMSDDAEYALWCSRVATFRYIHTYDDIAREFIELAITV